MENLSKSSCTIPIYLEESRTKEHILSESSIHALNNAFQTQGIHHLVFSNKQLLEEALNKLNLLYAPFYNNNIYINKTGALFDDINQIESGSLVISLHDNNNSLTDHFLATALDLLSKNTINIILISYTSK